MRLYLAGKILGAILIASLFVSPDASEASVVGRAAARSAKRKIASSILRKDHVRDMGTQARPVTKDIKVYRYAHNKNDLKNGIAPNKHMTPNTHPGRLPRPETAQRQYGLPNKPKYRETVVIKEGQPVRHNKALAGERGRGELTSPKQIPKEQVVDIKRLPQ
ncbi:MAG: hypothetical protein PHI31_15375 [Desulfuromonadaceae bacterium]|nr:hypothetical protein [Desulfuromonadaceae bacterium]